MADRPAAYSLSGDELLAGAHVSNMLTVYDGHEGSIEVRSGFFLRRVQSDLGIGL